MSAAVITDEMRRWNEDRGRRPMCGCEGSAVHYHDQHGHKVRRPAPLLASTVNGNGNGEHQPAVANRKSVDAWPVLDPAALHGPVGSFVRSCAPYTEADPAALLTTALVVVGNNLGRGPHVLAGNSRHPGCLYVAQTGPTGHGGKGTSWSTVREVARRAFGEHYVVSQVKGGFGSGEKLIDDLAGTEEQPAHDPVLVVETEMPRMLKVAARETSILSMTLRNGWDGYPLEARSRGTTSVAKDHHIGVVAHITAEELRLRLSEADTYGGFANRFLWVAVRRARRLPKGGNVPDDLLAAHAQHLGAAVGKGRGFGHVARTPAAEDRWADLYDVMGDDEPGGLLGAVIARAEQQVLRLSLVYAVMDGARAIDVEHLEAAWALWRYCRTSADLLFGDRSVNPDVDRLLAAIRGAGPAGLDLAGQMAVFGRNRKATAMEAMRADLEARGLIVTFEDPEDTGGRRRTVSVALTNEHESTNQAPPSFVHSSSFVPHERTAP